MITVIETADDRILVTTKKDIQKVIEKARSEGVDIHNWEDVKESGDYHQVDDSYALIEIERRISIS